MKTRYAWCFIVPLSAAVLSAAPATEPTPTNAAERPAQADKERNEAYARVDMAKNEMLQLAAEAGKVRDQLRSITGRFDVSPQALSQAAARLETVRDELLLDRAGAQARKQAVAAAIASHSDRAASGADNDPVVRALADVVKENEFSLKRLEAMAKQGSVSSADLSAARAALATAQANLAEKRREAALAAGGDQLNTLNRELTQLTIAAAERDARLAFIEKQLSGLRDGIGMLDQQEAVSERLQQARDELRVAQNELRDINLRTRGYGDR